VPAFHEFLGILGPPCSTNLILAWWQLISLVAGTVVVFAAAYVTFMRQEVRA
jgi:ABC-type transport system involved in multi-copper enzyme maturation permease subunit